MKLLHITLLLMCSVSLLKGSGATVPSISTISSLEKIVLESLRMQLSDLNNVVETPSWLQRNTPLC